jgi:hypothetical protein
VSSLGVQRPVAQSRGVVSPGKRHARLLPDTLQTALVPWLIMPLPDIALD